MTRHLSLVRSLAILVGSAPLGGGQHLQLRSGEASTLSLLGRNAEQRHPRPGAASFVASGNAGGASDLYACLEERFGQKCEEWVAKQHRRTVSAIGEPRSELWSELENNLNDAGEVRVAHVKKHGHYLYNFFNSKGGVGGIWRRTTLDEYKKPRPSWTTVLDLQSWAQPRQCWWHGCDFLEDGSSSESFFDLCLAKFSCDEIGFIEVREFNVTSKQFVEAPQGFVLSNAKTIISYESKDAVLVATTAVGEDSLTASGQPSQFRRWIRGGKLEDAPVEHEGKIGDEEVFARRVYERMDYVYDIYGRRDASWRFEWKIRIVKSPGFGDPGKGFRTLPVPEFSEVDMFADQVLVTLHSDFGRMLEGTLAATSVEELLEGSDPAWTTLFEPKDGKSLRGYVKTQDNVVLNILDKVRSQLVSWKYEYFWDKVSQDPTESAISTFTVSAYDARHENHLWVSSENFLDPPRLVRVSASDLHVKETFLEMPFAFRSEDMSITQHWARSQDGSRVPFFVVRQEDAPKNMPMILYAYGGFGEVALPFYSAALGKAWLTKGGGFALANVRGGGELGPSWHEAAERANKQRSFEDLEAVAKKLIDDEFTSSLKLGIWGHGPGGLLACGVLVRKGPELVGAAVCDAPLLDLGAIGRLGDSGPSVVGKLRAKATEEFGDPDNAADWEYMKAISPYNLVQDGEQYPPVLLTASTRAGASRMAHPAHARKMAAKMQKVAAYGGQTFLFEETFSIHNGKAEGNVLSELPNDSVLAVLRLKFFSRALGLGDFAGQPFADSTGDPPEPLCTQPEADDDVVPEKDHTQFLIAIAAIVTGLAGWRYLAYLRERRAVADPQQSAAAGSEGAGTPQVEMT